MSNIVRKFVKKLLRVSGIKIINDSVYTGVVYALTGNFKLSIASLSTMKVVSAATFCVYDEWKTTALRKALGWEVIISALGTTMNFLLTGSFNISLTIMLAMKVVIPLNWLWLRLTDR